MHNVNYKTHKMSKIKIIFLTIILLNVFHLYAQVNDAQLWSEFKISHKLSSNNTLSADFGLRISENISEIGTAYSELDFEHKLSKMFEISAGYRFFSKRKNEDLYSNRHRLNIDVTFKTNYYLFGFQLRTRGEMEYKNILSSNDGMVPEFTWCNKAELKYNFSKKIKPFFYLESYNSLSESKYTQYYDLTKYRCCIGGEYKITKRKSLEFYYLFESELNQKNPERHFITGVSYICTF